MPQHLSPCGCRAFALRDYFAVDLPNNAPVMLPFERKKWSRLKLQFARILVAAYFFAALIFAQRALAAALILALAAALIVNFFLVTTALVAGLTPATTGTTGLAAAALAALILAHLAFWAATSLARPAALMPPFFFGALAATGVTTAWVVEPNNRLSSFS